MEYYILSTYEPPLLDELHIFRRTARFMLKFEITIGNKINFYLH